MMVQTGVQVRLESSCNLGARWGVGFQRHEPEALPRERNPVPFLQEAGWAAGAGNIAAQEFDPRPIKSVVRRCTN